MGVSTTTVAPRPVPAQADLALTIDDEVDPVLVGEVLTYKLTLTNNGRSTATQVTLFNGLGNGVELVDPAMGMFDSSGLFNIHVGQLLPHEVRTISLRVIPRQVGTIDHVAGVAGIPGDPVTGNNIVAERTEVIAPEPCVLPDLVPVWEGASVQKCGRGAKSRCSLSGAIRVNNIGSGSGKGTVFVSYYLSADTELSPDDTLLTTRKIKTPKSGRSAKGKLKVKLADRTPLAGKHVIVHVDPQNTFAECDDLRNNVAASPAIIEVQ